MMIDSPKVESTGTSSPPRALRSSTRRWSAQPTSAIAGATRMRPRNGSMSEAVGQNEQSVGRQHRQAAVGEIDDAHDAEHEREPAGDQRVIAAEQHALNDLVEEDQCGGALLGDGRLRPK